MPLRLPRGITNSKVPSRLPHTVERRWNNGSTKSPPVGASGISSTSPAVPCGSKPLVPGTPSPQTDDHRPDSLGCWFMRLGRRTSYVGVENATELRGRTRCVKDVRGMAYILLPWRVGPHHPYPVTQTGADSRGRCRWWPTRDLPAPAPVRGSQVAHHPVPQPVRCSVRRRRSTRPSTRARCAGDLDSVAGSRVWRDATRPGRSRRRRDGSRRRS